MIGALRFTIRLAGMVLLFYMCKGPEGEILLWLFLSAAWWFLWSGE